MPDNSTGAAAMPRVPTTPCSATLCVRRLVRASSAKPAGWYSPVVMPSKARVTPSASSDGDRATSIAATAEPASVMRRTCTEPSRSASIPAGSAPSPKANALTLASTPRSSRSVPNSASIRSSSAA